jgi:hypothetical protein
VLDFVENTSQAEEYRLGCEIEYNGMKALVVRIVDQCALFEIPLKRYAVDELYVELLTEQGETIFVSLKRKAKLMPRPEGQTMRGPEPLMKMSEDGI